MKNKKVSIIIRTKNEERWIGRCLKSIFEQDYKNFEVIIVDNYSTDKTLAIAKTFPIKKIIKIKKYLPGKSLNLGIKHSSGFYVACISSHCVAVNNKWLSYLVKSIKSNKKCAGVYGRQEPMSFSSASDKRDLLITFGLDKKIQKKDSFFHNANSLIKKQIWKTLPFDEKTTNIEDRMWAQEIIKQKFFLIYEPKASVFHHHGIHHENEKKRLDSTVNIIEKNIQNYKSGKVNPKKLKIAAIIPIKGNTILIKNKTLLEHTINAAKKSKFINKIFVSTDSKSTANLAKKNGASCPFIRPKEMSASHVSLESVYKFSLKKIENRGEYFDLIVHLEETFPFRPDNLIDEMINYLLTKNFDSVIASKKEPGWMWTESSGGSLKRIDSGDVPRLFKEKTYVGLKGLCCVTYPEYYRTGNLIGKNVGLYDVQNPLASFEVRSKKLAKIVKQIL